jgi:uncharacterized membrane-anchored protein
MKENIHFKSVCTILAGTVFFMIFLNTFMDSIIFLWLNLNYGKYNLIFTIVGVVSLLLLYYLAARCIHFF